MAARCPISEQRFDTSAALQGGMCGLKRHRHTHTYNVQQGGALFPVRNGDERSHSGARLDMALRQGPLVARSDILE